VTLKFLRDGIEIKMGVILQCKLVTQNKSMTKLPCASLFQILSTGTCQPCGSWSAEVRFALSFLREFRSC